MKMFKVRNQILYFLLLILGVAFNPTPDSVHKSLGVSEILSEESLELDPRQEIFSSLVPQLVLVPSKAYPVTKE